MFEYTLRIDNAKIIKKSFKTFQEGRNFIWDLIDEGHEVFTLAYKPGDMEF